MEEPKLPDSTLPNFQQSEYEKPPSPLTCQQNSTLNSHKGLITYDDLPSWHQDNPSIFTSYRPITHSLRDSLKTFFTLHNETFNIHTHSIPFFTCLLLTGLIFYIFSIYFPESPLVDRFIFSIFFLSTMICMGFSMGYHTLMNHSKGVAEIWLKLDFVGIVLAILGDFVTGIYVAFYCEWKFQVGYWIMVGFFFFYRHLPSSYSFPRSSSTIHFPPLFRSLLFYTYPLPTLFLILFPLYIFLPFFCPFSTIHFPPFFRGLLFYTSAPPLLFFPLLLLLLSLLIFHLFLRLLPLSPPQIST